MNVATASLNILSAAEWSALLLLATATSFTPGPNTTLSTALAANRGLRGALHFVASVPVGWGLLFSLCALGLGSLVLALPVLRWAILLGGVGYLLWLARRLWGAGTLAQGHRLLVFNRCMAGALMLTAAWMLWSAR